LNLITVVVVGFLIGLIFSYPNLKKIISIYQTPIHRINNLPESGRVQIIGRVDVQNTKSPLKRKNCSLWHVEIQGYMNQYGRHRWSTIYSQTSCESFEISDGTGRIQIFPATAHLILHDDFRKVGNFLSPLPPRIRSAIEELGIPTTDPPGIERQLRVYERIVKTGDEVYVLGEVHYENGSKVIKKVDKFPFVISDRGDDEALGVLFKQTFVTVIITTVISVIASPF
jgi:hypothetical protein